MDWRRIPIGTAEPSHLSIRLYRFFALWASLFSFDDGPLARRESRGPSLLLLSIEEEAEKKPYPVSTPLSFCAGMRFGLPVFIFCTFFFLLHSRSLIQVLSTGHKREWLAFEKRKERVLALLLIFLPSVHPLLRHCPFDLKEKNKI